MSRSNQRFLLDLRLRAGGLLLMAIGVLIFHHLYHGGHTAAGPDATLAELALAAIGFLCASAGTALTAVGAGLLDPVEISERWVTRASDGDDDGAWPSPAPPPKPHGPPPARRLGATPAEFDQAPRQTSQARS